VLKRRSEEAMKQRSEEAKKQRSKEAMKRCDEVLNAFFLQFCCQH
jgi:hypothetical protein